MSDYQNVFQRYEKKYLMAQEKYSALRKRLADRIAVDRYGLHTICNLYYDTDHYDLIRTSLDKPVYKEKLRLRSYGIPGSTDTVFLEIKKKYDGIVYKRRIPMPLCEAETYLSGGSISGTADGNQIQKEIDWFIRFYNPKPRVYIAYDRLACYAVQDPELRITFDQNIRFRTGNLTLAKGDSGIPVTEPGMVLMELKLAESMPLWLCRIVNEIGIYPVSFSKYGACYSEYLMYGDLPDAAKAEDCRMPANKKISGGIHYA